MVATPAERKPPLTGARLRRRGGDYGLRRRPRTHVDADRLLVFVREDALAVARRHRRLSDTAIADDQDLYGRIDVSQLHPSSD